MINQNFIFELKHNKIIRFLIKPIMEIKANYKEKEFHDSKYPKMIEKYKEKYKGERCFIIGNGPSLSPKDLDLIKNEKSFAANRIYNIFPKTEWRPSFYVSTDMDILRQEQEQVRMLSLPVKFITYNAKKFFGDRKDIIYLFIKGSFELVRNKFVQKGVSENVAMFSEKTQTVTCVSMELAMYMGFTRIYLLGVDHNFSKYVNSSGKLVEDRSIQNYFEGMQGGDSQAILYTDDTTACYKVVKQYADSCGVKIFNSTRGGMLEVYPRIKLEDIL